MSPLLAVGLAGAEVLAAEEASQNPFLPAGIFGGLNDWLQCVCFNGMNQFSVGIDRNIFFHFFPNVICNG